MAATIGAQREAGIQRGRAEALEQQLAQLGDLSATLGATLAQTRKRAKHPISRDKTTNKRSAKRKATQS